MRNGFVVFCGVGVGVGVDIGVGLGEGGGVGEGEGMDSSDTMRAVFSFSPAVIKNSPVGTPPVLILSTKSPFESAVTFIDMALFRFTEVAPSAASPYTVTSFLPFMFILAPCIVAGKEIESVAILFAVAFSGPDKGYSIVCQNTGLNEARILFTFSAVTENVFSPAGK
jgi:hypothetical protein